uniref:Endo-1,4-beta-glucanase n=1 Tax=Solanum tuberosum TaxID=4113 RepID=M1DEV6_SOLTU
MSWIRNSGLQDGKHVALTMLQTLVEVFHRVGYGLHLSLPLSCVLPMLSRSVSEYHANYETLGELNHVNNGIIAAFNMISVPRILWPMGHLEKLQVFSYHSHVQREVNYAATLNKAWNEALEFSHKGLAGACH